MVNKGGRLIKERYKESNVLVTGATGMLGSWLTARLIKEAANVVCLVRDLVPKSNFFLLGLDKTVTIVYGDLCDYQVIERTLNEYEIDTCFHLGAQALVPVGNRAPLSTFESNIRGSWNVLEACRNSKLLKRLIIASSDKAYGSSSQLPYTEEIPLRGLNPYDVSKTCVDLLSQSYFHTYGSPLAIARCGNFYGGGDFHFSRIIPGTIYSLLTGKNPVIRSDGTPLRDYIYIDDVVEAYLTLGENLKREEIWGEGFNFGTETPISVIDLVNKIIKISGRTQLKPVTLNEARNEIQEQYLSCKKARKLLGWKPRYSLDKGLRLAFQWYKDFYQLNKYIKNT